MMKKFVSFICVLFLLFIVKYNYKYIEQLINMYRVRFIKCFIVVCSIEFYSYNF